ncbi:hypothetical protein DY120_01390 [Apilactobacillus micheneri]|uniref:Uncharacterized protein n=1 Tax=Apilactobacillus micheneri TaxID=1899430 RepID=A0ABY2YYM4_9LACO|nr:hypothetical protein [Apilactobacillus micheneri]TPR26376.1 hypothetical protein DY114_01390 [Apilactobacillus micheneri]TPR27130.1 hypothetical protein DY111_01390 [Apilactobacillus micheneri]TPR27378.1 hypothetical protein DY113_06340 [Apilactobacillus micheneri]TPR31893.1 hypothetical protein DY117_01390 [Apilactobacillus micheneri]TPR32297.1 hypothetical protein DY120_01390 [Apilactobacillus micheneri]
MKRFAIALSLFTALTFCLIFTNNQASANSRYTNRNDYTNVYKYIASNRGNKMIHFHNFKRLGKTKIGRSVSFNGIMFCYIPKVDGYVPFNQMKKIKKHKHIKNVKRYTVAPNIY